MEISPKLLLEMCVVGIVLVSTPLTALCAMAFVVLILPEEVERHSSNARSGAYNRVLDAASPAQMGLVAGRVQLPSKSLQPTLTLRP